MNEGNKIYIEFTIEFSMSDLFPIPNLRKMKNV